MNYPSWVGSVNVRKGMKNWHVTIYPNSFNCRTSPVTQTFYIPQIVSSQQAVLVAIRKARKTRLYSRGCWILSQVKAKYGDAKARKELFGNFCKNMKAKYDGENYLYENESSQNELIKVLNVKDLQNEKFQE